MIAVTDLCSGTRASWHAAFDARKLLLGMASVEMALDLQIAARKVSSVNPATGEVLRELDCASDREVLDAVARARVAQAAWNGLGIRKRSAVLKKFQQLLHERKTKVAELISREAGKPCVEALTTEVVVVLDTARYHIENGYSLLRDQRLAHANLAMKTKSGRIIREPYGVIGNRQGSSEIAENPIPETVLRD